MVNINELVAIIDGVNCGGTISDKKIEELRNWVGKNCDLVYEREQSEIIDQIELILMEEKITDSEKEYLLFLCEIVLGNSVNNQGFNSAVNRAENKINYLRKQVENRKNIGIDLIEIFDDENTIKRIHYMAESELSRTLRSYSSISVKNSEIVFISLVLIGMLKYDASFYEYVRETYSRIYQEHSEQKIEGLIRGVLKKYRIIENDTKRDINNALHNAIVPAPFLASFFDFVFDIYKQNFEYEIPDNENDVSEEFKFVYNSLRNNMSKDDDEIKLSVTKKTYKLIRTTKELIYDNENISEIIKLSIIVVKIIDKYIWGKPVEINNSYLKQGYEKWVSKLEEKDKNRKHEEGKLSSRWEPIFGFVNNKIILLPQIHSVKNEFDYREIVVKVFAGSKKIYEEKNPKIKEIIGGYRIYPQNIVLDNPLDSISYKLICGNSVIYDSKDQLFRSVIIFSPEGKEIKNNSDYEGTVIICHNKAVSLDGDIIFKENYTGANYNVKLGESLIVGDDIVNFSKLRKPGVLGKECINHFLINKKNNKSISVFNEVNYILFENRDDDQTSYNISINDNEHAIDYFNYRRMKNGGLSKYKVNLEEIKSGIYEIKIIEKHMGKRKVLHSFEFALDKGLKVDQVKINEEKYLVSVDSDLIKKSFYEEVNIKDYSDELIGFSYVGCQYKYIIPFEFEMYKISGNEWCDYSEDMWIGDINQQSCLSVFGGKIDEIIVYSSEGKQLEDSIKLNVKGAIAETHIGFLMSYKEEYDYLMIALLKNGVRQESIFCYNRCIIDGKKIDVQLEQSSGLLSVKTFYYGKGQVYFSVVDDCDNEVFRSNFLNNGDITNVDNITSFEKYRIVFKEKLRGLSLIGEKELYSLEKKIYRWKDFLGRVFKIKRVYFDQFIGEKHERKQYYFNFVFLKCTKQNEDGTFSGEIFNKQKNGKKFWLYNINPVEIELCEETDDEEMVLSITKEGDGLLLDFKYHCIMNSMDEDAPDIFMYVIDTNGEKYE